MTVHLVKSTALVLFDDLYVAGGPVMTATQNAPRTARERARAELTREIKEEARRQLAATGADGLSLRAVARELGMVSSALYRYYPSRDDLLTALIIDAYDAIGEAAEQRHRRREARRSGRGRPRPLAGRLPRHPRLGARPPARVRADLRLPGPRLPRPGGDDRPGRPGAAGVRRRAPPRPRAGELADAGVPRGPRRRPSTMNGGPGRPGGRARRRARLAAVAPDALVLAP
jgi:AcrR family transcriptional regulator